jgi:hypothetical protein
VHDRFVVVVAVGVELVLEPVSAVDEAGGILVVYRVLLEDDA